jgi:uncharacterized membrane protein (DUF2068 family)
LQKSFSARAAFALFAAATVFFAGLFVYLLLEKQEIRTGVATYGLLTAIAALGLWRLRSWGRSLALLITLMSAGLGTLTLLSVLFAREGSVIVPAIVLVASVAASYWISRL